MLLELTETVTEKKMKIAKVQQNTKVTIRIWSSFNLEKNEADNKDRKKSKIIRGMIKSVPLFSKCLK